MAAVPYFPKRLFTQLALGVIAPSLSAAVVFAFFFAYNTQGWPTAIVYMKTLYPAILMLTLLVNLLYLIWFFIHFSLFTARSYGATHETLDELRNQLHSLKRDSHADYLDSVEVRVGTRRQLIYVKDLPIFEASAERRVCTMKQGGVSYDFDYSLDVLAARLDPKKFYKVNRRYILNRAVILGYRDRRNGSVLIRLNREVRPVAEIVVSRGFAKDFKNWYIGVS